MQISINAAAQEKLTMDSINKKMEEMFNENKWDQMIPYGENALRKGFDFFFLRARLGIAYYMTKKYFEAIPNFEKSLEIGYDNPTVLEYLYYCYLYTGREADKSFTFSKLPKSLRKRIKPLENSLIDNLHSEVGTGISNDPDKNSGLDLDGDENYLGEQTINGNEFYFNAGLSQLPVGFLNVNYIYSYLKTPKTQQIQFNNEKLSFSYSEYQDRFYNSFDIKAATGLVISPAGHYISTEDESVSANYDSSSNSQTDSVKYYYTISEQENLYNSFVLSLDISKYISIFKFGVNGSFSYLNKTHQSQYGISFKVFPFGKVNFFSYTNIVLQNQSNIANIIVDQSFTGQYKNKFFYEIFATVGKINNYNEHNGFRVYNSSDLIKYKLGLEMKYYITPNFRANFIYSFQNRQKNYETYASSANQMLKELNYQVNNFVFGINYDF